MVALKWMKMGSVSHATRGSSPMIANVSSVMPVVQLALTMIIVSPAMMGIIGWWQMVGYVVHVLLVVQHVLSLMDRYCVHHA